MVMRADKELHATPSSMIDETARDQALHRYGIPESLHVPTAAVDEGGCLLSFMPGSDRHSSHER